MALRISKAAARAYAATGELQSGGIGSQKYGAKRTVVGDLSFDSAGEAHHWAELQLMQRVGLISELERQVAYDLHVNGQRIGAIRPDYRFRRNGEVVVSDFKSPATITPLWKWKRRHLLAEHGVVIEVVQ